MPQAPQAGLRAWQTRRPCQISRCDRMVHSDRGISAPTSCSILSGSVCRGPAEAPGQPGEVRVHGDAGHAEGVAQHDVGRLPADPGQGDQVGQLARHLPAEPVAQGLPQADEAVGLGPEEPGGLDDLLHLGPVGGRVVGGGPVAREQHRGDQVDPLVRGLRGQDRGDQQFQRGGEVELSVGIGIEQGEFAVDAPGPADERGPGGIRGHGPSLLSSRATWGPVRRAERCGALGCDRA